MYLAILISLIGLFFIYTSFRTLDKFYKSKRWKVTKGVITKSDKISTLEFSKKIVSGKDPFIIYDYSVRGKSYSNRKIFNIDTGINKYSETDKLLNKYPCNEEVSVYYNEEDPKQSYLELASAIPIYLTMVLGFALSISVILILLYYKN